MTPSQTATPPRLPDRPVVRVVHPCGSLAAHRPALEAGLARLERAGCAVRWDPKRAAAQWRGYLAGRDACRRDELVAALAEPDVDAVWFARGGSGGARIADAVARAAARMAPRIVVGFSDATVFLNLLTSRLGWVTFHGPVVTSLAHPAIDADIDDILQLLRGERTSVRFARRPAESTDTDGADAEQIQVDVGGSQAERRALAIPDPEGVLMGGNLTVLAASIGTSAAPSAVEGALWLLEDIGEAPYSLDRSFWQAASAGLLEGASGLWIGDLGLAPGADRAVFDRFGEDSALPVYDSAPAGHRGRLDILPIGGRGRLDLAHRRFVGTAPWVGDASRAGA